MKPPLLAILAFAAALLSAASAADPELTTRVLSVDPVVHAGHARYHPAHPPGAFEMREVGAIWNVTPTVGPDGCTIDLSVLLEASSLAGWDDLGPARTADGRTAAIHLRQPRFLSHNLTTSVVLRDGATVVLGGFRSEDGKETIYAFISARLVNPAGRPANAAPASRSGP